MTDGLTPLTPEQTAAAEQRATHEVWLRKVFVGVDQLLNVFTGGNPDETISARAARAAEHGSTIGKALSEFLNVIQPDHGALAVAGDDARAEKVEQVEEQSGEIDAPSGS